MNRTNEVKVGDRVWVSYFGKSYVGQVIEVRKERVCVRLYNRDGGFVNLWRKESELELVMLEEVVG